ncbi:MAG: transporter substrate-binding domain-containing protein [Candidatus Thiodiazotropha sp. (ex Dulcina madagascariensis)]|nr:transporter substrate-binding domain-containing protein [Candidatus Thiodiazotropha sp. (ex Dulcina madagascariensis)]MCU7925994.1 transporter substrate-binding domain-containing protein [Candidatus Thiodiazotropha sp. (ex Dulcina madagascariensis)]
MSKRISIKVNILTNFLIVLGLIGSSLILLQYYFSQQLSLSAARETFEQTAEKVIMHLVSLDDSVKSILSIASLFPEISIHPEINRQHELLPKFVGILDKNPGLYAIYLGYRNDDFYEVINMRSSDKLQQHYKAPTDTRWTVLKGLVYEGKRIKSYQYLDENLNLLGAHSEASQYRPSSRPWFRDAEQTPGNIRTKPYMFSNLRAPGVTFARKIKHADAVLAVDLTMETVEKFLARQSHYSQSEIFMFDEDGRKFASSENFQLAATDRLETDLEVSAVQFTQEEKAFLEKYPEIRVSNEIDWVPYDFTQNGQPRGYSVDLIRLIAAKTGMQVQFVNGYSWAELVEQYTQGNIDILQPLYYTKERERMGLFSKPMFFIKNHFIVRDNDHIDTVKDLFGDTLAIPKGWASGDFVTGNFPQIKILKVDNGVDALKAVASGNARAAVDTPLAFAYLSHDYFIRNLKLGPWFAEMDNNSPRSVHMLVHHHQQALRSLLDRAIDSITEKERELLRSRWLEQEPSVRQQDSQNPATKMEVHNAFLKKIQTPDVNMVRVLNQFGATGLLRFRVNGELFFAYATELTPQLGSTSQIGMIVKADSVLRPYMNKVAVSMFAALAFLLLSIPVIMYSTSTIIRPIKSLMAENRKIEERNFNNVQGIPTRISEIKELSDSLVNMAESIQAYQKAQDELMDSFIRLIASAIDAKSPYTGGHCERVPRLAMMFARAVSDSIDGKFEDFRLENDEQWREFEIGAWLHDCGKVTTPEYVVDKATKLETIYNRIHEIRMRFEVLWRDVEIEKLQRQVNGDDTAQLEKWVSSRHRKLISDFAFVAECNIGGEYMSEDRKQRLARIAEVIWMRHFDDRIGISQSELKRREKKEQEILPCPERLIADKSWHITERSSTGLNAYERIEFNMEIPDNQYNIGEFYNLCIERGTLTNEERYKINEHVIMTIKMLEQLPLPEHMQKVPEYAGTHHETMNGTGYPHKLARDELSIPARIMAIADIFEALTASDRPYKKAKTLSESLRIMSFMSKDQHIDSDLFEFFLRHGIFRRYADLYLDESQVDEVNVEDYLS